MKEKSTIVSLFVYVSILILIFGWTLSPWLGDDLELATLTHAYPQDRAIDGYEKLLYDAINNDQSHFVHADEVMEKFSRIVDDLLCTGTSCPIRTVPYIYVGGWGPQYKVDRITDWDYPS